MKVWHISYPNEDTPGGYAYEWFPSKKEGVDRIREMKRDKDWEEEYEAAKNSLDFTYIPTNKKEMLSYLNDGYYFIGY